MTVVLPTRNEVAALAGGNQRMIRWFEDVTRFASPTGLADAQAFLRGDGAWVDPFPNGQLRARVTFNGSGTVAIQSAGNVASITDLGVGNYRINFATSLVDTAYTAVANCSQTGGAAVTQWVRLGPRTTTSLEIFVLDQTGTARDSDSVNVAVFR